MITILLSLDGDQMMMMTHPGQVTITALILSLWSRSVSAVFMMAGLMFPDLWAGL